MTPLLTPRQAAVFLGVSVDHLNSMVEAGELPFVTVGLGQRRPRKRYDPADIEAYIGARKCRHTAGQTAKHTPTISSPEVVDIQEILAARRSAKRTGARPASRPKSRRN